MSNEDEDRDGRGFETAWYDATLSADFWFRDQVRVTPEQAAMLLCNFNPREETVEGIKASGASVDGCGSKEVLDLLQWFESVATDGELARPLLGWLTCAQEAGLRRHPWADQYARSEGVGQAKAGGREAASPPAEVDQAPSPHTVTKPDPIATGKMAFCFGRIYWSEEDWKKNLGNKPLWLRACMVEPGQQGVRAATWDPVRIAAAIVAKNAQNRRRVRARFQREEALKPWLQEWETYEEEFLPEE